MNDLSSADDDDLDVDDYDEARLDAILPDDDRENKELVGIAPRKPAVPSDTCARAHAHACLHKPRANDTCNTLNHTCTLHTTHHNKQAPQRFCPYLDSINRHVLDFDFEKVCSISNSHLNVYACLVCGKYFGGRARGSPVYFHSLEHNHHVIMKLDTGRVYCTYLPIFRYMYVCMYAYVLQ